VTLKAKRGDIRPLDFPECTGPQPFVPWPDARGPLFKGVSAIRQKGPGTEFPILAAWRKRAEPDPLIRAALLALGSPSSLASGRRR